MNNIFNFKRFVAITAKEVREYFRNYGISIISILGIYLLFLVLPILVGGSVSVMSRINMIMLMTAVIMIVAPSKLFGTVNHQRKGLNYVLLPVSTLEKTLSMLFITSVFTTFIMIAGLLILDTVGYLIMPLRLNEMLFTAHSMELMGIELISLLVIQSWFVLGNMLFRNQKVAKTILSLLGLVILIGVLFVLVFNIIGYEKVGLFFEEQFSDMALNIDGSKIRVFGIGDMREIVREIPIFKKMMTIQYILWAVISLGCWIGTYRLIKTRKY
ncbi:MAG: hypothetical protein PHW88_02975 [Bacteroidales bacterium]|jgi:hypothetical protein|nr:hypothetical protein [Bacteroidales bacterium]MDD3105286.1 hypothetical protein [Bacteroidales bacterium]MDD3549404.1 hypothetical protein [Bacteroidales bacterium]MDD4065332.1 hypothetical protein [Bacteroidales bacterium]MDD4499468.1 hypothetical protein [Bacteroidales bacterium]